MRSNSSAAAAAGIRLVAGKATEFRNADAFAPGRRHDDEVIQKLGSILELRGEQKHQAKIRDIYFQGAGLKPGMSVLEVGCGTGVVARHLARYLGKSSRVAGIDLVEKFIDIARNIEGSAGTGECAAIEYQVGDAYHLPYPDHEFDATLAATLFSHLPDKSKALVGMIRVTRPGGIVMAFDQDYETLIFAHEDKELTRKILRHGSDWNITDGWTGRRLPGLFAEQGLEKVKCIPFVYSERDTSSYLMTIAVRFAALCVQHGVASKSEADSWIAHLREIGEKKSFFSSINYYCVIGEVRKHEKP
jgi:ubiquinone/menaquinone biosynthesis C-methylase UbiE